MKIGYKFGAVDKTSKELLNIRYARGDHDQLDFHQKAIFRLESR